MTSDELVIVDRPAWQVRFVEGPDSPVGARACWDELEALLPSLRGRKFAGVFDADAGWYRACVRVVDDPSDAETQLPVAAVPGGRYLRLRLRGEPSALYDQLPAAFDELHAAGAAAGAAGRAVGRTEGTHDPSRPSIELYRSHGLIDALLPVQ